MRSRSEHSSRFLPMTIYTRPVQMLLCGLLLLTLAIAVLNTLVPLWLAHENMPTWQVGMVGSSYFTGNLAGTLLAGWVIKRLGFNRSYYLASLIFAVGCVGLGITVGFWTWLSWRFIAGVGCAMIWVVVESALVCSGTSRSRGRLLAAYMMVYYVGTVLGQLMVSKLPTDLMSVLPWVTGLALAAILPLLFTRIMGQAEEPHETVRIWPMLKLRQARHGVNGCIISGIVLGSLYGLMPLWLNHQGVSDSGIGFWMAVMVSQAAMAPALFVLGAAGFPLYPVAMAWACEKVEHHQLVAMNQALLMSYTIGSLLGPTLTAMLMQNFSDNLLFIMIASVSFIYLLTLLRKAGHHPTPVAHA